MSDGLTKLGEAARRARAAISPWQFFSPTDVAGFAPGGGIPSAVEPYKQGLQKTAEATKAFREGRYGDAAKWYGSGVLDTGTAALSALPEGGALTKMAMVPLAAARRSGIPVNLPADDVFKAAVANTPGASVTDDGLVMSLMRRQKPEQALEPSVRGGVFYLPEGDKNAKYYSGTGHHFAYGGLDKISGETAVRSPLFVKGATGGKAPEAAFDQLLGKGSYQKMRADALHMMGGYGLSRDLRAESVERFLQQYAPELSGMGYHIVQNSSKGNQLAYALQEAAVASAARNAGHDAVVGFSTGKNGPRISEVFDVREDAYPSPEGDFSVWRQFRGE